MWNFDETSGWIGWSKNEFSHSLIGFGHAAPQRLCLGFA
jgi:hypothetical protein